MGKVDEYRATLKSLDDWDAYLLAESRLPGPRANLELAYAVGHEGTEDLFLRLASLNPVAAPQNTPQEFLAFCGVLGLGYLATREQGQHFALLRERASDSRWRVREAVALGLQQYGQHDPAGLLRLMSEWRRGNLLERRAVVATLCEPGLLADTANAEPIFETIDTITASLLDEQDRRADAFKVLRQALAYGWSVIVAAQPAIGRPRMERWIASPDPDLRWIMKQNLTKNRMLKMDGAWTQTQLARLEG